MDATVELDKLGRFVVPKRLRDALHIKPGDKLKATVCEDVLTIEPLRSPLGLHKHNGRFVFDGGSGADLDIVKLIREDRANRMYHVLGILKDE